MVDAYVPGNYDQHPFYRRPLEASPAEPPGFFKSITMSKKHRPPLPDLTDDDLKEIFGPPPVSALSAKNWYQLFKIPRETLDEMPYIERQWCCAAKDCQRTTTIRDYGHPRYMYWRRRWTCLDNYYYLCGRHKDLRYHTDALKPREEHSILLGNNPKNFTA